MGIAIAAGDVYFYEVRSPEGYRHLDFKSFPWPEAALDDAREEIDRRSQFLRSAQKPFRDR
ncbi:hypothetical protein [Oxynema aestuarii]|jgi:hypothetical protein|uniref:Uncharacterized protein n=1 Tax=Oxynema aestuarii AP17 TaxID=2064643 RepID=A0A6H1TW16_9CYAN|nr:hypothetical protein [Oxynema aestuarii]QIZ70771.1 hypothetical protein HCG48_09385 [Oxynema aestuarii AP17]RMH78332.1 MAG: hypothetical protein D6680_02540 [Cyanobacteria bacterium J007]